MANEQWDHEQIAEECKKKWRLNTGGCRDEFRDLEGFTAYCIAEYTGQARILGVTEVR